MTADTIAQVRQLLDGPARRVWIDGVRHWVSGDEAEPDSRDHTGLVPALATRIPEPVVKPTCADCGGPVSVYALRCLACVRAAYAATKPQRRRAWVLVEAKIVEAKKCLDCPQSLSVQTGTGAGPVRCQRCAAKERWRLKRAAKEAS